MKFLQILQTLSESERKEFDNYLKAPIGRKPRVSNKIIEAFTENENFESFMNENFNKRSRWNTYSELTIALEDFLAAKSMLRNTETRNELLADEFSSRGLTELSKAYFEQEIRNLTSNNPDDESLIRSLHLQEKYSELLKSIGEIKKFEDNLNLRYETFAAKSVLESLMFQLECKNNLSHSKDIRIELFNSYNNCIDLKKIIQLTKKRAPRFYQLLNITHKILNLYTRPYSLSSFENVRNYFYENMDSYTRAYKAKIYFMLINYLINLGNSGFAKADNHLFELLKKKISDGITDDLEYGNFDRSHFRDYVAVALRVNELKWASEFTEKYSSLLPPAQRENELNVVRAMLSVKKKDFVTSIKHIEGVKRIDYMYTTDFFRILIISKFELNEYMECLKQTNKFKRYLWTATDIPEVYSNRYKRFLKITTNLIDYKQTGEGGYLDAIDIEIEEDKNVPGFNWIMEKTKELIKLKERRVSK